MEWSEWWGWELELTPHLEKRMEDRVLIDARHQGRSWDVIVEPDLAAQLPVVVTAYPLDRPIRRGMT